MGEPVATETHQLRIQGVHVAQYVENVLHYRGVIDPVLNTHQTAQLCIDAWVAALKTLWLAMCPSMYTLVRLAARRVDPPFGIAAHKQFQIGVEIGARSGNVTSQNLCPSVRLVPIMGTKSVGKVFLPCVADPDIEDNIYSAGYATAVSNFFTPSISGFTVAGNTWRQVVKSRKYASIANIDAFNLSPRVGYQGRRRNPAGV